MKWNISNLKFILQVRHTMAIPLRCLRAVGRTEIGLMGMLKDKKIGRDLLLAGQQRRWQTSSGLGDSNSATEGEFGHICSF